MTPIQRARPRTRQLGVTLIELMIVVVIIGILAAIGYPSYRAYMQRTHRSEAKSALLQLQTDQERHYLENNTYTSTITDLGSFDDAYTENGIYELEITSADAQGFEARATPSATGDVDMSDDDECTEFTITSEGERGASPDPNGKCW